MECLVPFHVSFEISSTTRIALKAVVLRPSCHFDTSEVIFKILMLGLYPRSFKSEFLGYGLGHVILK